MIGLEIKNISKRFGKVSALESVSLSVEDGELFFLLGPSGCGKTTLLRIIAGFCEPDGGDILFHGESLLGRAPEKRNIGMVFQNYSLWPHMTVWQNVAYGLKMRKRDQKEIDTKVAGALDMVSMSDYADRKPAALSGGEQQRIALARALVYEPEIVLLDEPLSNLDAKLRKEMRNEIRSLHERLGITMIYVTHDQDEAATMADRIALFQKGTPIQVDNPENLYRFPQTVYAAEFFGDCNSLEGSVAEVLEHAVVVRFGEHTLIAAVPRDRRINFPVGTPVVMIIRPEDIHMHTEEGVENMLFGQVLRREFLGGTEHFSVNADGVDLLVIEPCDFHAAGRPERGGPVTLGIERERIHLLGGRS